MFEIRPNALYSRQDLLEALGQMGVDADNFIARIKPRKFVKQLYLGQDLLDACRRVPELGEGRDVKVIETVRGLNNSARRGSGRRAGRISLDDIKG
jgi:hypothetical protein